MGAKKETTTGRSWECPKCHFILHEAAVEYSAVGCTRTLNCRKGVGTAMQLVEPQPAEG